MRCYIVKDDDERCGNEAITDGHICSFHEGLLNSGYVLKIFDPEEVDQRFKVEVSNDAVWKKPAWLTAIVGVISIFLTVPDVIGNYLTKQQDIELAKEKTAAARLKNLDLKQDQEFKIVNNTLAEQGTERVFLLRYLSATLDDPAAKTWASEEVNRLDQLATTRENLNTLERDLKLKEVELQKLRDAVPAANDKVTTLEQTIYDLRRSLESKNFELAELKLKAGISGDPSLPQLPHKYRCHGIDLLIDAPGDMEVRFIDQVDFCFAKIGKGGEFHLCNRGAYPEVGVSVPTEYKVKLSFNPPKKFLFFEDSGACYIQIQKAT